MKRLRKNEMPLIEMPAPPLPSETRPKLAPPAHDLQEARETDDAYVRNPLTGAVMTDREQRYPFIPAEQLVMLTDYEAEDINRCIKIGRYYDNRPVYLAITEQFPEQKLYKDYVNSQKNKAAGKVRAADRKTGA